MNNETLFSIFKQSIPTLIVQVVAALFAFVCAFTLMRYQLDEITKTVQANGEEHKNMVSIEVFKQYQDGINQRQADIIHRLDLISGRLDSINSYLRR